MLENNQRISLKGLLVLSFIISGCNSQSTTKEPAEEQSNGSELLVVDCLLPGQIRQLGQGLNYLTARKPTKTSAVECEIRGGEYVSYDRADYKTALSIWLPQAQQNNAEAQVYVGEIYEKGYGLASDYKIAAHWYEKAASQGNSRAQINLGYLYEKGLGVQKDLVSALNWYRKASGLENDDIAFASTIETAVKAEYQDELNLLRNELDSSQTEINGLQKKLEGSRKNYHREQKKLYQLTAKLKKTSYQLEEVKLSGSSIASQGEIKEYEKKLQKDAANAKQQLKIAEQMKASLNRHNSELEEKLKQVEQRSAQLGDELTKHQEKEGQLKARLINLQTQLASSKLSISQLTDGLADEQHKINKGKEELNRLKVEANKKSNSKLNQFQSQLVLRTKELEEQQQLIEKLQLEKSQISREKNSLSTDSGKTLTEKNQLLDKLNNKLNHQNIKLEKQQAIIAQLYTENKQQNISKMALEQDRSKDFSIYDERIAKLESQLGARENSLDEQLSKIQAMEKEKLEYEQKIKRLQAQEKKESVHAKPSIVILEPPFTMTRSNDMPTVKLRSIMTHREVTGRVIAPAGLASFNINGVKEKINASGIFNSLIELKDNETPVKTVVIDKAGNKASLEFMLLAAENNNFQTTSSGVSEKNPQLSNLSSEIDFGTYHALIIGNQDYQHFHNLDTPVNDAKTVERILREKYGFNTTLIVNANRYAILSALNKLRAKLTEVDNLLIYYAGHGELDRVNLRGHWLPIDAEANNTANWISTIAITDILNAMSAKQVLVVADSCYSGAMTRSSLARIEAGMSDKLRIKWLKLMSKTRSRTVLTSGGLKPVLDSGKNGHSIFANAFIKVIAENNTTLEGQELYRKVNEQLMKVTKRLNFKQEPQYAPIKHGGHEAGDFFLVAKN